MITQGQGQPSTVMTSETTKNALALCTLKEIGFQCKNKLNIDLDYVVLVDSKIDDFNFN